MTLRLVSAFRSACLLRASFQAGTDQQAGEFGQFRHGYAGTIYKGQGRTLDQTYLYHSEHWRSASSYVALTRHRQNVSLFVATETARDLGQLARQMARIDDTRAASQFYASDEPAPVRPSHAARLEELRHRFRRVNAAQGGPAPETEAARRLREAREIAAEVFAQETQERGLGRVRDRGMGR